MIENACYLLAAIPAFFIAGFLALVIYGFFANAIGLGFDFQNAFVQLGWNVAIYATLVQIPLYIGWALISKELPWSTRLGWAALLWAGNMATIPCFLVAKYFRIANRLGKTNQDSLSG